MIKRDPNLGLIPSKWTGVGGHVESKECFSPYHACIREICEEASIHESDIKNMKLRYITINMYLEEVRQSFYFFGELNRMPNLVQTNEGVLKYVKDEQILGLDLPIITRRIIEHRRKNIVSDEVFVCVYNNKNDTYQISSIGSVAYQ